MIAYLVTSNPSPNAADEYALSKKWIKVAAFRWATPERDEIRVIHRMADLALFSNGTRLIKAPDYEDGPERATEDALEAWIAEKEQFDRFVAEGAGKWIECP